MVFHVSEDVVINVAEEVDFRLHAPIISGIRQSRVPVEHAAVPAAHFVVRYQICILNALFEQDVGGFFEQIAINPRGDVPMVRRDDFC